MGFLVPLILIMAVFYFMILRPQKKKDQQRRDMLSKLAKGDRIITIGGIHGEVQVVKENHVIILVDRDRGTTLKMGRSAINTVLTADSESSEQEKT